jgi:Response regulator containing CheY-like receiver domain and AraC-type DNA-binding domain
MEGLECRRADCWFDSSVMKRIRFWQREAESLSREESEEAICVFNVRSDTAAAVLIAKRSIPGTFAGREEFREAFLREWDKWESARFFGDTPSRPRLPSSAASLALQQIRTELLVLSRAFDLGRLKAKLSEWAAIVSQLELKLLRKECALLMGLLEEGFVHSDTVLMLEEDKIQYWLSWVRQFRTWTDLVARIRELIAEATRALKELKEEAALGGGIVEQAMAHIRKSSYSDLSLENVASAIGVHPVTLSRMFKQKIGVNFVQYLTRHRLEHARQMLISSNKTVREIAEEIGYSDYRYFCSLFKKESGFLPREYRNLD